MDLTETLKLALSAIWAHKLRSFLTLLGMIIAVAAFMVVFSLLQGFNVYIDEKIAGIGSNSFTVQRFNFDDFKDTDTIAEAQRRNKELTFDDLEFIRSRAQVIDKIGAKVGGNRREVKVGPTIMEDVIVDGAEPVIGEIENIDVLEGRYFTEAENNNGMRVAFIGTDVVAKLWRNVAFGNPNNFSMETAASLIDQFRSITAGVAIFMVVISSVGLMIGGIGVMNIMLVSVTERTREIGIRKAVGAKQSDILLQFLIEAATLTGFGGLLGLLIGWLLTLLVKLVLPSYVPLWAPAVGFVASVGIGLIFGLWPAWKAARLDPIESLRYE